MAAAVVELDALADAVGAGRQDDRAGLLCLVELGRAAALIGEVVVRSAARELAGAGVDGLYQGTNAEDLADGAHRVLALPGEVRELDIGEAHLLGGEHVIGVKAGQAELADALLGGHDVGDAVEEPLVDLGRGKELLDGPPAAERLGDVENALRSGLGDLLGEVLLVEVVVAVGAEAGMALLKRPHGLLHGLLEGGADGHDLAHGLHARGQAVGRALELLEGEARDLDHAVVDGRLEARRGGVRDVVLDLVEGVADGKKGRHLCDGETGGLGSKGGGAGDARVHLDDDDTAVLRVHGELDVGAAAGDAHALEDRDGVVAQALKLVVV